MLEAIDSYEITEWMAFERAFGPIGPEFSNEALAHIHDQIVLLNKMFGQQFEDNPADDIERIRRPTEIYIELDDEEED